MHDLSTILAQYNPTPNAGIRVEMNTSAGVILKPCNTSLKNTPYFLCFNLDKSLATENSLFL